MYGEIKTRKGKANLFKTDKNTYAVNLPVDVSREIFHKPRKRIRLGLIADSRESTFKALQHVEKIQSLLDAQDWQALIEYEESLKPKIVKTAKVTLQSLWKDYLKAKQEGWEISYREGDIKATTQILESIADIYPKDNLDDAINYLLATTTVQQTKRYLKQISACLTWGKKRRLIQDNPLPDFISTLSTKRLNEDTDINPFTIAEREAIVNAFRTGCFERYSGSHTRYADYVEFSFLTGARTSEVLGLKWEHVDFEKKMICLQEARVLATTGGRGIQKKGLKTQRRRIVPMSDRVYRLLLARKKSLSDPSSNIFEDINHAKFRKSAYKYILDRLGIPYRKPYQTRHTFITILANHSDLKLHQVAKICGTSTKIIEAHYLATNVEISRLPDI